MSQADELLDSLTEEQITTYTINPTSEPHIIINPDRTVTVPEELKHIAVQGEHNIETVTFDCPRYWDGHDLSVMSIRINYQRPDGHREPCPVENLSVDESDINLIHFDWTISGNVTVVKGNISFMVCAKITDVEGRAEREWHSRLNQDLVIDEGLECSGDEIVEQNPDILESILVRLDTIESTGGVSDEQVANAVADYLAENPVEGNSISIDPTLTQEGQAADAKAVGDVLSKLSGQNANLSTAQIEALHGMFKVCGYDDSKDVSGAYAAFLTAFGITDTGGGEEEPDTPVEPDEPEVPEVTLSSISATYSGGDVTVGTAVTALTGVVVTANYSDGSTATVTGYTLSGTIAEGSNTVTVTYQGKTTTFAVTGVTESSGDDTTGTDWEDGVAYDLSWTDGYYLTGTGEPAAFNGYSATDFTPCAGVTNLVISKSTTGNEQYCYFYDSDKNKIESFAFTVDTYDTVEVPENAAFFRISVKTDSKDSVAVAPNSADLDTDAGTDWTDGVAYTTTWEDGRFVNSAQIGIYQGKSASDYMPCNGAATISFASDIEDIYDNNSFFDVNRIFISKFSVSASTNWEVTVPETAAFIRVTKTTSANDPVIIPHA